MLPPPVVFRRFLSTRKVTAAAMRPNAAIPPTIPPTMAPMLGDEPLPLLESIVWPLLPPVSALAAVPDPDVIEDDVVDPAEAPEERDDDVDVVEVVDDRADDRVEDLVDASRTDCGTSSTEIIVGAEKHLYMTR